MRKLIYQTYFFNFNGDLYGEKLQLQLLDFLREEQKFDSVDSLKAQLSKDRSKSMALLSEMSMS